ncbi:MAG: efflux RND transporter periplasmic adaptor subunit [Acidobacteria bacterium]|nr:efflux RND transporter periplasmic adaptor subunit [Acidobacteriota bacterium]
MTLPFRLPRLVRAHRRETGVATAGVVMAVLAGGTFTLRHTTDTWPTATARTETFVDTIVETGTIGAQRLRLYASTIPGAAAKLVELAPEGQAVREGDVLARFDTAAFEQTRERELAALRQADAELVRVREAVRIESLSADDDLDVLRQDVTKAENGLANQISGRGAVEVVEAEAAAADAARELEQARTTFEDMTPLLAEGFITRAELDRAEQALRRAEDRQRLAAARLRALVKYERPAATSQARSELNATREALDREREATAARAVAREAALAQAAGRVEEIRARVALLDDQIARATIRAEGPGLVVYRDLFFGSDQRKPQVGDEVFPNQALIAIPDASQLIVETRIREIDLHKVSASQRVLVRVDAYPDLRLRATVAFVGALAQADAARAGTRFFPVTVKLAASDPRLRTGMTARVEIEAARLPRATVVPVHALFDDRGEPYVVLLRNGRPERRTVEVVASNESLAALVSGVAAGDRVLLVDPTAPARP